MLKRLTVSAVALAVLASVPAYANTACFTPDEAKAAHFRTMLQEFNVAALNCQSTDPNDTSPSIRDRYNSFVSKHGSKLSQNAQAVRSHFARAGGNLDMWMTKVANADGQAVMTDPEYCQHASDKLDKALELQSHELEGYASTAQTFDPYVDECPAKAVPAVAKKTEKAQHHKKKPANKTTAQND
ncbi:MAG TPA: hypothetical protein VM661_07275 [Candidatus Sulfotelmatobacter sp.]|nr:hypothetical protein [Candidatus Sulfotelmatobacter sp.]